MSKKSLYSIFCLYLLFGCNGNKNHEISYHTLNGELVNDSIYTRMPGELFALNDHIVWYDPFNSENYIHYIDKHTGKEVVATGRTGQGPDEFSTPILSKTYDNNMFLFELSGKKQAFMITDSVIEKKQEHYIFTENIENDKINTYNKKLNIDNNTFVSLSAGDKEAMFALSYSNDPTIFKFGRQFISNETRDAYNLYQGNIIYNEQKNRFIYTNFYVSYVSIYEYNKKEKTFSLLKEIIEDFEYNKINDSQLALDKSKSGFKSLTLSKDFVIMHRRDYKSDNTNEAEVNFGSFDKLPKTVFLYDYDGHLRRIVNLGVPVLRIAANIKDNTLYIIAVDPEYVIMKYNLEALD